MKLSIIVAMDSNNLIGVDNALPWHLPEDLKYFKSVTTGKSILMGRKTYESIGRPLPNRRNIVLTRSLECAYSGVETVNSIEEAIDLCNDDDELMVIGGTSIYKQVMGRVDTIYLTQIDGEFVGDSYFPIFAESEFKEVSSETHTSKAEPKFLYHFKVFDKV